MNSASFCWKRENVRLKKMYAGERLKAEILKEAIKKVMKLSHRCEMAQRTVKQFAFSIRLACDAFSISEKCYLSQAKLRSDNLQIADWLLRLTHNQRNWGLWLVLFVSA